MPNQYIVGRAPRSVYRVAICPTGCEGTPPSGYVIVPDNQMSYTCGCGAEIATVLINVREYERTLRELEQERFLKESDLMQASFAPVLNFTREDE